MAESKREIITMKKWIKPSTLKFFERNTDALMLTQVVDLSNEGVIKAMSSAFEYIARDTYFINFIARSILSERLSKKVYQEEEVFGAEDAIAAQIVRVNDWFDRRITQAEQKLELNGFDPDFVVNRFFRGYQFLIPTQTCTSYTRVLKKADHYMALNHALWSAGALSVSESESIRAKLNNEREARGQLFSISRESTKRFEIIQRICRGVIDSRKQARAKQSQLDKEKNKRALEETQSDMDRLAGKPVSEAAAD